MTNQKTDNNRDKAYKNSSNTVQKSISLKTLIGSAIVLLSALGFGMVIREYRSGMVQEKQLTQAPESIESNDVQESQNIRPQLPIEEVVIMPEPVELPPLPEPVTDSQNSIEKQTAITEIPQIQDPRLNDPVFKEELGRYALDFVGFDPAANQIWATLINDPSLSQKARRELIEDLNDNGFPDGDGEFATVDDLPLILSRIQLIESLAPYAMDEVNADAFDEAHKDLVEMADRLTR